MVTIIDAVYEGGLFRPIGKVELSEGTRVQVRIQAPPDAPDARTAAAKLRELAARSGQEGPGVKDDPGLSGRDHDALLYDRKNHP
jgi:predicted DNA-binding antitoxin AbrB/MazE fold protein